MMKSESKTIALAGQPNTGKSSIFNRLTGSNQHIGNWPGKTVEKKQGRFIYKGRTCNLVDLPGTYSLTANSAEEIIARDFIIKHKPDLLVVVVDASQLERTLYLAAETAMLRTRTIIALNMMDIAQKEGRKFRPEVMGRQMGVKVIPTVAAKNKGISALLEAIKESLDQENAEIKPEMPMVKGEAQALLNKIGLTIKGRVPAHYPEKWTAAKLVEGDEEIQRIMKDRLEPGQWQEVQSIISQGHPLLVADSKYEWIEKIISSTATYPDNKDLPAMRHKFDRIAAHPLWGKLAALMILFMAVTASVSIGYLGIPFLKAVSALAVKTRSLLAPAPGWVSSMMADGIIVGVGLALALSFFLMAVFIVVGFLEDVGYLARLAYVFDSFMQGLGLHGKSFMPFLMGFCCNISGLLGTRVVDSWRQRLLTVLLVPIIPCFAVWAIVSFIGTIFFGTKTILIILALLITAAVHLAITSFFLRKAVIKGKRTGLIMELPPYHMPNLKTIWTYAWTNEKAYLKRGFTVIALTSFCVWLLAYFPDGNIETSFLASVGKLFTPIASLMGFDWRLMVALIAAMVSKESALAAIGIVYGFGHELSSLTGLALTAPHGGGELEVLESILMQAISPAAALAFLFVITFSVPCSGTIGVLYSETTSLKWTAGATVYYTASSLVIGILVYHAGLPFL